MSPGTGLGCDRLTPLSPTRRRSRREAYRLRAPGCTSPSGGARRTRAAWRGPAAWPGPPMGRRWRDAGRGGTSARPGSAVPRRSRTPTPGRSSRAAGRSAGTAGRRCASAPAFPTTPRSRPALQPVGGLRSQVHAPWPGQHVAPSHTTRSSVTIVTPEVASQPSVVLLPCPLSPSSTQTPPSCRNAPPWIAGRPIHIAIVEAAEVRWGAITHSGAVGRAQHQIDRQRLTPDLDLMAAQQRVARAVRTPLNAQRGVGLVSHVNRDRRPRGRAMTEETSDPGEGRESQSPRATVDGQRRGGLRRHGLRPRRRRLVAVRADCVVTP